MGIASIAKGLSAMSAAKNLVGAGGGGEGEEKGGVVQEIGKAVANSLSSLANASFTNIDDKLNGTQPPQMDTEGNTNGGFNLSFGTDKPKVDEDPATPETTILDDD